LKIEIEGLARKKEEGMHRTILVFATVLALCAAGPARAGSMHGQNISISTDHDGPIDDCRQVRVTFDREEAVRAEETLAVPSGGTLRLRAPAHSGISVQGGDARDFSVTACKAAASEQDLARISVSLDNGDLSLRGPESHDWLVYLIVRAPRSASLDLEVGNGPLSVRGISGAVTARTENGPLSFRESSGSIRAEAKNGPISLKDCTGTVDAQAVNGPVTVSGSGGDTNIQTQNGPISVRLNGTRWDGKLEARASNGPLSLSLPDGYRSGVRVESAGRSPFQCRARACADARKDWSEDSRRVDFGDASPVVRLSTVNGPVSIRSDRSEAD
jgi:hypothetical protein